VRIMVERGRVRAKIVVEDEQNGLCDSLSTSCSVGSLPDLKLCECVFIKQEREEYKQ